MRVRDERTAIVLKKTSEGGGGGVAKTCLVTNQLVTSCVNTDF